MSGFGIVRRMDELGRIVIPKELRRIMRLKEGDEMEIFSEGESLVVRKHSRFDAVRRAADKAVRLLHERTGCDVFLIAADKVAAAAGPHRKELTEGRLTEECAALASSRETRVVSKTGISPKNGLWLAGAVVATPVVFSGDVVGALVCVGENAEDEKDSLSLTAGVLEAVYSE